MFWYINSLSPQCARTRNTPWRFSMTKCYFKYMLKRVKHCVTVKTSHLHMWASPSFPLSWGRKEEKKSSITFQTFSGLGGEQDVQTVDYCFQQQLQQEEEEEEEELEVTAGWHYTKISADVKPCDKPAHLLILHKCVSMPKRFLWLCWRVFKNNTTDVLEHTLSHKFMFTNNSNHSFYWCWQRILNFTFTAYSKKTA